jgi:hypothetical protein
MSTQRLYELLMESDTIPAIIKARLMGIPVIVTDQVAREYEEVAHKEKWDIRDLPNVAPPWERFYMEYRSPSDRYTGFLVTVHDGEYTAPPGTNEEAVREINAFFKQGARWLYELAIFTTQPPYNTTLYAYTIFFGVKPDGYVLFRENEKIITIGGPTRYSTLHTRITAGAMHSSDGTVIPGSKEEQDRELQLLGVWAAFSTYMAALSINFMNMSLSEFKRLGVQHGKPKKNRHKEPRKMSGYYGLDIIVPRDSIKTIVQDSKPPLELRRAMLATLAFRRASEDQVFAAVKPTTWHDPKTTESTAIKSEAPAL